MCDLHILAACSGCGDAWTICVLLFANTARLGTPTDARLSISCGRWAMLGCRLTRGRFQALLSRYAFRAEVTKRDGCRASTQFPDSDVANPCREILVAQEAVIQMMSAAHRQGCILLNACYVCSTLIVGMEDALLAPISRLTRSRDRQSGLPSMMDNDAALIGILQSPIRPIRGLVRTSRSARASCYRRPEPLSSIYLARRSSQHCFTIMRLRRAPSHVNI